MDPQQFLTALWGDPPPGQVPVWMLPQKRSSWYLRLDRVCRDLAAYPERDISTPGWGWRRPAPRSRPKSG